MNQRTHRENQLYEGQRICALPERDSKHPRRTSSCDRCDACNWPVDRHVTVLLLFTYNSVNSWASGFMQKCVHPSSIMISGSLRILHSFATISLLSRRTHFRTVALFLASVVWLSFSLGSVCTKPFKSLDVSVISTTNPHLPTECKFNYATNCAWFDLSIFQTLQKLLGWHYQTKSRPFFGTGGPNHLTYCNGGLSVASRREMSITGFLQALQILTRKTPIFALWEAALCCSAHF